MKQKQLVPLCLVLFLFFSFSAKMPISGYAVGDKAIDFSLKSVSGKQVSMRDYANAKGVIVVFTCNHCPYAKLYEERIIALHRQYAPKGFPVIAINPNDPKKQPEDSFDNMVKRAKEKNYPFEYLVDETQSIAAAYGAQKTPHVYLLAKKDTDYIVSYIGAIDNNAEDAKLATEHYVANAIDAILLGKNVEKTQTKAIGCTIKWKE